MASIELLKAIYETRINPIHSMMTYCLSVAVGIAAILFTIDASLKTFNLVANVFLIGIAIGFLIIYSERLLLEIKLSNRLAEHLRFVATRGRMLGDFETAVRELSIKYGWDSVLKPVSF